MHALLCPRCEHEKEGCHVARTDAESRVGVSWIAVFVRDLSRDWRFTRPSPLRHRRYHDDEHLFHSWHLPAHRCAKSIRTSQPDCLRSIVELRSCGDNVDIGTRNSRATHRISACLGRSCCHWHCADCPCSGKTDWRTALGSCYSMTVWARSSI